VGDGHELVKAAAKAIAENDGQPEINQSQHTLLVGDLPPRTGLCMGQRPAVAGIGRNKGFGMAGIGANPKRAIFSVKPPPTFFHPEMAQLRTKESGRRIKKTSVSQDLARPVAAVARCYGWISSVHRNFQVAIALIAIDTTKSDISATFNFAGPLPVSRRNIHGSRIIA